MNSAEVLIKFKGDDSDVESKTNGLTKTLGGLGKVFMGAATVATTAMAGLTKSVVNSYAEYEQLIGGVETLFGTGGLSVEEYAQKVGKSVDKVIDEYESLDAAQEIVTVNAYEAYKNAGIGANEYMKTVTSFSAALKQSISDPIKLAEAADQAVIDMSDNANKMGTSMESIQTAYQGFAKQNYTMLDNLKLGYGGTKSEMERLLKDASKISGIKYNINNLNDVYSAIHIIQTELGITGTTAKEAEETISGSMGMVKASFDNFLISLGEGQGIDEAFQQLVQSAMTFGQNLLPVIQTAVSTIVSMLPQVIQTIATALPQMVINLLPQLIEGTVGVINGLIEALPEIITMIADVLPDLIPIVIDAIMQIIPILIEHIPDFINAGFKLITGLIKGLINAIPNLLSKAWAIFGDLLNVAREMLSPSKLIEIGINMVKGLWEGINNVKDWVLDKIKGFGTGILDGIKSFFGIHSPSKVMANEVGKYLPEGMAVGIEANADSVNDSMNDIQKDITSSFGLNSQLAGTMNVSSMTPVVNVYNNMETDPLGQVVNTIKTFSGGSKNDYNYGMGN